MRSAACVGFVPTELLKEIAPWLKTAITPSTLTVLLKVVVPAIFVASPA